MNEKYEEMMKQYQENYEDAESLDPNSSLFAQPTEENIAKWQLDLTEDLDRIYHLLQGHYKVIENGNEVYKEPEDENQKPFNEFGVQTIMNIMSFYLNRNTILSNYDEETIKVKVLNFGKELTDLIHNKYQEMMLTMDVGKILKELTGKDPVKLPDGRYVRYVKKNLINGKFTVKIVEFDDDVMNYVHEIQRNIIMEKVKIYPMIVRELVDTVHSAYNRAYHGGERESLRKSMHISQSNAVGGGTPGFSGKPQGKKAWFNPFGW